MQPTPVAAPTPADTECFKNNVTFNNLTKSTGTITQVISETPTTPAALNLALITSNPLPSCIWATCNLLFQVGIVSPYLASTESNERQFSVYYWPPKSQKLACLSTVLSPVVSAPPVGLNMYHIKLPRHDILANDRYSQSPSIYVVYKSVTAYNGCNRIGLTYANIATSFSPSNDQTS